jgi:hypothetical protein
MPNPWKLTTILFATTTALGLAAADPQPVMRTS